MVYENKTAQVTTQMCCAACMEWPNPFLVVVFRRGRFLWSLNVKVAVAGSLVVAYCPVIGTANRSQPAIVDGKRRASRKQELITQTSCERACTQIQENRQRKYTYTAKRGGGWGVWFDEGTYIVRIIYSIQLHIANACHHQHHHQQHHCRAKIAQTHASIPLDTQTEYRFTYVDVVYNNTYTYVANVGRYTTNSAIRLMHTRFS